MQNTKNKETVKAISQKVEKSKAIAFFEYKGLGANVLNDLRKKAKEASGEVLVAKNTLVKIALGDRKAQASDLSGQTGVLFSYAPDVLSPLKSLFDFAKKFDMLKVKGALIEGTYYLSDTAALISSLPSRTELIARVLAGFNTPVSGFVTVLNKSNAKLVYALAELAKKKEVGE